MPNILRKDFDTYTCNSDGEPIEISGKIAILYNTDVISSEEVDELIMTGTYEHDDRIVVTTQAQADNLKGKKLKKLLS